MADKDSAFYKGTNNFSNTRTLEKHDHSKRHQRCIEAKAVKEKPLDTPIHTAMTRLTRQQNEVFFSLRSFPALYALQEQNGLTLSKAYRNRMAASSFVFSIANVMRCDIIEQINSREHFSLLIDGSTDEGKPTTVFLLMSSTSGTARQIL